MGHRSSCRALAAVLLAWGLRIIAADLPPQAPLPLDEYIRKPDPAYEWKVEKSIDGTPLRTVVIHLKSQTWRTTKDVDRPLWEHWLVVASPATPTPKTALLMIGGGSHDRAVPTGPSATVAQIATATGSVVAELSLVPNQPLVFHGDGQPRKEDDLIGYCWDQYLQTGDATWLPRLPMTKSVVRALDCLQEWSAQNGNRLETFVVAGASKRGWTTWMAGAADRRVTAIIPLVIDVLNIEPSLRHHAEAYGFWAEAVGNYYQHKIFQRPDHPRLADLYRIEDPYCYRDRLALPKYVVNASGDQFFCPTSSPFYWDDLPGEKLLRYVPNADHGLKAPDVIPSVVAFYQMILNDRPRPRLTWSFAADGAIRAQCDPQPQRALLWQATNPQARDFRLKTIGKAFTSTELKPEADGSWLGRASAPKEGWTASFIEFSFASGGTFPLQASTAVRVLPDTLPHRGIELKQVPYEADLQKQAK